MGRSEEKEGDSSFSAHERGERKAAVSQEPFNWKTKEKHYSIVVADAAASMILKLSHFHRSCLSRSGIIITQSS